MKALPLQLQKLWLTLGSYKAGQISRTMLLLQQKLSERQHSFQATAICKKQQVKAKDKVFEKKNRSKSRSHLINKKINRLTYNPTKRYACYVGNISDIPKHFWSIQDNLLCVIRNSFLRTIHLLLYCNLFSLKLGDCPQNYNFLFSQMIVDNKVSLGNKSISRLHFMVFAYVYSSTSTKLNNSCKRTNSQKH